MVISGGEMSRIGEVRKFGGDKIVLYLNLSGDNECKHMVKFQSTPLKIGVSYFNKINFSISIKYCEHF